MQHYVNSLEEIKEICHADKGEALTKAVMKEYRKVTGKLSWLANSTRPDMSYASLSMSRKNNCATIADLRNISQFLKKAKERPSRLSYSKIEDKDNLIMIGVGDASFKVDEKAVGGVILLLSNTAMTRAVPIYWMSKYIAYFSIQFPKEIAFTEIILTAVH